MSETATESTTDGNQSGSTSTAQDFKPITTPGELDAFLKDRVARAERKATEKFADYDDLKSKAAQLDALAEASQTEAEKTQKRLDKAEAEVAAIPAKVSAALRDHLVKLHEIDQERADLFLTATDPELLLRQVNALLGEADNRRTTGPFVTREGTSTRPADSDERHFARSLFAPGD